MWCGLASHGMASLTILVIGWYQLVLQCWTFLPVTVADPWFQEGGFRDGAREARAQIWKYHKFCSHAQARNDHEAESDISCWHSTRPRATFRNTDTEVGVSQRVIFRRFNTALRLWILISTQKETVEIGLNPPLRYKLLIYVYIYIFIYVHNIHNMDKKYDHFTAAAHAHAG